MTCPACKTSLTPYRDMERVEETSLAEQWRVETDQANETKLQELVTQVLVQIKNRVKDGKYDLDWPWQGTDQETAQQVMECLEDKGFSCRLVRRGTQNRWWRAYDPHGDEWGVSISW